MFRAPLWFVLAACGDDADKPETPVDTDVVDTDVVIDTDVVGDTPQDVDTLDTPEDTDAVDTPAETDPPDTVDSDTLDTVDPALAITLHIQWERPARMAGTVVQIVEVMDVEAWYLGTPTTYYLSFEDIELPLDVVVPSDVYVVTVGSGTCSGLTVTGEAPGRTAWAAMPWGCPQ